MILKRGIFILVLLISAMSYCQSAGDLFKEGKELRNQGKKNKAIKKFEESLETAESSHNSNLQIACHIELAELKDNVINYKEALEHYKAFTVLYKELNARKTNVLKDSVSSLNVNMQKTEDALEDGKIEFEQQSKAFDSLSLTQVQSQLEIANLEIEREKHLIDEQASANNRNILLFVIGIVLLIALFVLFGYARKRKINKTLRNKNYQIVKEKEKSEELLLNILPKRIADELMTNGRTSSYKYEMATVMFTDFKGFTKFSESHTSEELVAVIDFYFSAFDEIISRYNIEKIKTIGDAYLCVSGIPDENKDQIVDTLNCAKEMQAFVKKAAIDNKDNDRAHLEMRVGIHCGPLVAGVVGTQKFAYDVWGDTVNIAARMEQSGETGQINVSEKVYELAGDKFKFEYRGEVKAKNKGLMKMYFIEQA